MSGTWDVVIVGGGPAGLAAAIYSGRALRKTLVLERKVFGGQIVESDVIENYPGTEEALVPYDLMERFTRQVEKYGVTMENDEVTALRRSETGWQVTTEGGEIEARAVIFATGSTHRHLGVPGEKELLGRGISVCATCDAPFFKDRQVAVLGGGDTALAEALHLAKFAAKVTIVHRRDELRAERILQDRARRHEKIAFRWNSLVTRFVGDQKLAAIEFRDKVSGQVEQVAFDGAFLAIGTVPNTALLSGLTRLDAGGYVLTDISLKTDAPGLFVAGEVIAGNHRQVAISTGMGVQAALSCEAFLAARE